MTTFRERAVRLIRQAIVTGRKLGLEGESLRDHIDMHFPQASTMRYSAEFCTWRTEVDRLLAPPLAKGDRVSFEMLHMTVAAIVIEELPPFKYTIKYLFTPIRTNIEELREMNILAAKLTRRTWPAKIDTLFDEEIPC